MSRNDGGGSAPASSDAPDPSDTDAARDQEPADDPVAATGEPDSSNDVDHDEDEVVGESDSIDDVGDERVGDVDGADGGETLATAATPIVGPSTAAMLADRDELAAADGRNRRRVAIAVLLAAVLAGLAGMFIGNRIQSPADRAAERAAPIASMITVPVERRTLTSELILNGEVAYNEPLSVALAGPVGIGADETEVVTSPMALGAEIVEGSVIAEVTGRPVIVLQGELPMYRRMMIGTTGPDVAQLELALDRLGYEIASIDSTYGTYTAAAVEQLYQSVGYTANGPTDEQIAELDAARAEVEAANDALDAAEAALAEATKPMLESERLQLDNGLQDAREAVADAETAVERERRTQDIMVGDAEAAYNEAAAVLDDAIARRDAAAAGAIDPSTGMPYTWDQVQVLDAEVTAANGALGAANSQLALAYDARVVAIEAAQGALADARDQLQLTQLQYDEALAGQPTQRLQADVDDARTAVGDAQAEVDRLQSQSGAVVPAGEIVFAPTLPSKVTESLVQAGGSAEGVLGTIATTDTLVRAGVSRVDAGLVEVGAEVVVEVRDAGIELPGTVVSVASPAPTPADGDGASAAPSGGESGRLEVTVAPTGASNLDQYVFYGARIRVTVDATDGEVLVVPVAALTVGPDEQDQLEVERSPATDDAEAVTEVVPVEVGLSTNGLAEVRPVDGATLAEGDRVVVGFEWSDRQVGDDREIAASADDGDDADDPDVESDESDESDDADGSETSPLDAIFGGGDPVAQRQQNLAIEEATAECMRQEGFEYIPVDWDAQFGSQQPDVEWGSDEFGEKYGYGVMFSYETYELGGEDGGGFEFDDPNQDYVMSLSPEEVDRYYAALYGEASMTESTMAETGEFIAPSLEEQGCSGAARFEIVGDDPWSNPDFAQAAEEYFSSMENDPRLTAVADEWKACIEPALADLTTPTTVDSPDDMYAVMEGVKAEAAGQEIVTFATEAEMNELFEQGTEVGMSMMNEDGSGYAVVGTASEISGADIDRLTELEVDLWASDQVCQDEVGFQDRRREIEQEFVDEMRAQFPDLFG